MASGLHEAENFDSKLARVILDWLAQIRQSDLQLPVDTGDFFSNYGQEVLLATLCVLQQHSQVLFCEYTYQQKTFTTRGEKELELGAPVAYLCRVLQQSETPISKNVFKAKHQPASWTTRMVDQAFERAKKDGHAMMVREELPGGRKEVTFKLTDQHAFEQTQEDDAALQRLRQGGTIPEKFERYLLDAKWLKITEDTRYLVNFGPCFDQNVSFEGIEGERDQPQVENYISDETTKSVYTRMRLAQQLLQGAPASSFCGGVFQHGNPSLWRPYEERRFEKDLPLADALALFMISKESGDVAACHLHLVRAGHYKLFVTKNQTDRAAEIHLSKLFGLCWERMNGRFEQNFQDFQIRALQILTPYCIQKMKRRIGDVSRKLKSFEVRLENSDPEGDGAGAKTVIHLVCKAFEEQDAEEMRFKRWNERLVAGEEIKEEELSMLFTKEKLAGSGDAQLLWWAKTQQKALGAVISSWLKLFIDTSWLNVDSAATIETQSKLSRLFSAADVFRRSLIFQHLVDRITIKPEIKSYFTAALYKVAAYHHGIQMLYDVLGAPCTKMTMPDSRTPTPLILDYFMIPSKKEQITLNTDWMKELHDFYEKVLKHPMDLSEDTIVRACGGELQMPETLQVSYHCELLLTDFLRAKGIRGGVIGVSKRCCQICTAALSHRNDQQGDYWRVSGGHDVLYVTPLPRDLETAKEVCDVVNKTLRQCLSNIRRRSESPSRIPRGRWTNPLRVDPNLVIWDP